MLLCTFEKKFSKKNARAYRDKKSDGHADTHIYFPPKSRVITPKLGKKSVSVSVKIGGHMADTRGHTA